MIVKKETPKGVKLKIFLTVTALLALVMLLITATFSWMVGSESGRMAGFWTQVTRKPNFLIREDASDWEGSVHLTVPPGELKPVCGDISAGTPGVGQFYTASLTKRLDEIRSNDDQSEVAEIYRISEVTLTELDDADLGDYVFTYEAKLVTERPCSISLSRDSSFGVAPEVAETDIDYPLFSSPEKKKPYGSYGAARIAILTYDETSACYVPRCVWIPNPYYEYSDQRSALTVNGNIEESYYIVTDENYTKTAVDTEGRGYWTSPEGIVYIWDLEQCPVLFSMDGTELNIKIVVWIDGTDRECRNFMSGGNATMLLKFTADFNVQFNP